MIDILSYELTQDAKDDLIAIRQFTYENWGKKQSNDYIKQLQETIEMLCNNDQIGIPCNDIKLDSYRFPKESHVIYYFISDIQLIVFGILHKSMVPQKHLPDRDPSLI